MRIRDVLKLLSSNGWSIVRQKGSHRQLRHPSNPNVLTVAGKEGAELRPGTLSDILKKAGQVKRSYAIVIEHGPEGCSAYSPDLPGCVAAAESVDELRRLMAEAIEFHIEGLRQSGQPVPEPTSTVDYVHVAA